MACTESSSMRSCSSVSQARDGSAPARCLHTATYCMEAFESCKEDGSLSTTMTLPVIYSYYPYDSVPHEPLGPLYLPAGLLLASCCQELPMGSSGTHSVFRLDDLHKMSCYSQNPKVNMFSQSSLTLYLPP